VLDDLCRDQRQRPSLAQRSAAVEVAIPLREVAARDLDRDAVAGGEGVRRHAQVDTVLVANVWLDLGRRAGQVTARQASGAKRGRSRRQRAGFELNYAR
jgi:hypothetical protein